MQNLSNQKKVTVDHILDAFDNLGHVKNNLEFAQKLGLHQSDYKTSKIFDILNSVL